MPCRENTPIACPERKAAVKAGEFGYLDGLGWVWWKASDVTRPWDRCPWCWGKLPQLGPIVDQLRKHDWSPPWDGEDRG